MPHAKLWARTRQRCPENNRTLVSAYANPAPGGNVSREPLEETDPDPAWMSLGSW